MWKNGFYISTESDDNDFTGMIRHQRYTFMCGVGKIFLEQGFYILVPDEGPRSQLPTINRE